MTSEESCNTERLEIQQQILKRFIPLRFISEEMLSQLLRMIESKMNTEMNKMQDFTGIIVVSVVEF